VRVARVIKRRQTFIPITVEFHFVLYRLAYSSRHLPPAAVLPQCARASRPVITQTRSSPRVRQRTRGRSPKGSPSTAAVEPRPIPNPLEAGTKTAAAEADASSEPDPVGVSHSSRGGWTGDRGRRPDLSGTRLNGQHFRSATRSRAGGQMCVTVTRSEPSGSVSTQCVACSCRE
jgi:hypothetical protein